jgi:hypothetical protein
MKKAATQQRTDWKGHKIVEERSGAAAQRTEVL